MPTHARSAGAPAAVTARPRLSQPGCVTARARCHGQACTGVAQTRIDLQWTGRMSLLSRSSSPGQTRRWKRARRRRSSARSTWPARVPLWPGKAVVRAAGRAMSSTRSQVACPGGSVIAACVAARRATSAG
jgi:hypothetical protein